MNFTLEIITKEGKEHFREINKRRKSMDNLEYLEDIKEVDDKYLRVLIKNNILRHNDIDDEYRKIKALEIIAEELINNNNTLRTLVTTLENIETAIIQRG